MTAKDKITKAKISLILSQPFWATLALGLRYEEVPGHGTASVDGITLRYDPEFIDGLKDAEEVKGLIAHEVAHVAGLHHTRRAGRDMEKWNIACDHAINHILKASGFSLPEGGCMDPAFKDMAAEAIYNKIPDPPKGGGKGKGNGKGGKPCTDPGGNGGVVDAPAKSKAEMQHIEQQTKQLIAQAAAVAKQQGKLPAHLERMVDGALAAQVNWKDVLNAFLTETAKNDYVFSRPNPRYIGTGLYLPTLAGVDRADFALIIDTSGSVDVKLLGEFQGEIQSVLADTARTLTVLHVDSEVAKVEEFESDDTLDFRPKGGGGTDFRPGFEHIEKHCAQPAAVLYMTDGFCNSYPAQVPSAPVLWVVYGNEKFAPPFGEVIHLN